MPFSLTFLIIAWVKGCSEPDSTIAASRISSLSHPISSVRSTKSVTEGFPTVSISVLSKNDSINFTCYLDIFTTLV